MNKLRALAAGILCIPSGFPHTLLILSFVFLIVFAIAEAFLHGYLVIAHALEMYSAVPACGALKIFSFHNPILSAPNTGYLFVNLLIDILGYFSLFIALMGFMCLADIVKHMSDKAASDNADDKTNT